jgi:hypothetical protein
MQQKEKPMGVTRREVLQDAFRKVLPRVAKSIGLAAGMLGGQEAKASLEEAGFELGRKTVKSRPALPGQGNKETGK